MNESIVLDIALNAIITVLMVSIPILLVALVVGLLVSIFQTVTSIQEPTLAFVPKILAVFVGLIIFGPFMLHKMVEYTQQLFQSFNTVIK